MDDHTIPNLLLVDDDPVFCEVMARALIRHGFDVLVAHDVESASRLACQDPPEYAVLDLKMPGDSGLVMVKRLHDLDPATRIVVLTGYASISTAVEAIKLGATHYLAKPADAEDIIAALHRDEGNEFTSVAPQPLSVEQLEWEHIQRVFIQHEGNVSATARALNMHRRTLQRKLSKRAPKLSE